MDHSDNWTDKEVVTAFMRMLKTVVLWVPWFIITLYMAVFKGLIFFDQSIPAWMHILFFAWLIITLPLLVWLTIKKIWRM